MTGRRKPPPSMPVKESELGRKHAAALERVLKAAITGGASKEDLLLARTWPLLWASAVFQRIELEPLADIGRRVRNSRAKDQLPLLKRNAAVVWCAIELLKQGQTTRGLAGKVCEKLKLTKTPSAERNINRILDRWMPILLR